MVFDTPHRKIYAEGRVYVKADVGSWMRSGYPVPHYRALPIYFLFQPGHCARSSVACERGHRTPRR